MDDLVFFLRNEPRRQLVCRNISTYTLFWPYFFAMAVPGARPLCRWAARRGAAVHGGLRLRMDTAGRCHLVATRRIPMGKALISLPVSLAPGAACDNGVTDASHADEPLEALASLLARHLNSRSSPYRQYIEFLHDVHNADDEEEGVFFQHASQRLTSQLDHLYDGNAIRAKGVSNAPFIHKGTLHSPEQRVAWIRMQTLLRQIEQGVPHFAATSAPWALSMALARAVPDDNKGLTMYPLIDFCGHSFEPNANITVCTEQQDNEAIGVKWHDTTVPCAHLISQKDVEEGETISRIFDPRRVRTQEDEEYWRMRYGFVPDKEP